MSIQLQNSETVLQVNPFVEYQQAIEEAFTISSHMQSTLLSGMALSYLHGIDLADFSTALASEYPKPETHRLTMFADQIREGIAPVEALDEILDLMPAPVVLRLKLLQRQGKLRKFYLAISNRPASISQMAESPRSDVGMVAGFLARAMLVFSVITFIMLKIIPEFQKIFEEFGIELPSIMRGVMNVADIGTRFSFVFLFLFIGLCWYCFPTLRYASRLFSPLKWREAEPSKSVHVRRATATALEFTESVPQAIDELDRCRPFRMLSTDLAKVKERIASGKQPWKAMQASRLISRGEASALEAAQGVDTRAWILRWSAAQFDEKKASKNRFFLRFFIGIGNAILAAIVIFLAISIVSTMVALINLLA